MGKGEELASFVGDKEAAFVYEAAYEEGDRIVIETEDKDTFFWVQLDDAVGKSMVYMTGPMEYKIPFGDGYDCKRSRKDYQHLFYDE